MIQSPIKSPQPAISRPSASPGQNVDASFVPSSSLAPPSSKSHNSPATLKRIVENREPISQKPRKRKVQRPRCNEPQRCGGGHHICTNKNGETRKATALQKEIVWLPSVRLACEGRKTWAAKKDLIPGFQSLPHTPLQLSWLFSSSLSCMRQDRLITCGLELDWGEGGPGSGSMGYLFLCQLIRKAWHFGAEF